MSECTWTHKRPDLPGYWKDETSGVLRPAVEAYLSGSEMSDEQIAAMRAYLRQWIASGWGNADHLRAKVGDLQTRRQIDRWLANALRVGIDPL